MCKNKNFNLATKAKGLILKISKVFSGQTLCINVHVNYLIFSLIVNY